MTSETISLKLQTPEASPERASTRYVTKMEVPAGKSISVDASSCIMDVDIVKEELGLDNVRVVAGLRAGNKKSFLLLDMREASGSNVPFLLVDDDSISHSDGAIHFDFKGMRPSETVQVGRSHNTERFTYDSEVSRDHFSVLYDEKTDTVVVTDMESANGTFISGNIIDTRNKHMVGIYDGFTSLASRELEKEPGFVEKSDNAPYGYYLGHPILGRKSRTVRNGVYGSRDSEQIVVDSESIVLSEVVDDFLETLPSMDDAETFNVADILSRINHYVATAVKYDLEATDTLSAPHLGGKGLIDLSEYVQRGVGVCRQQALVAALVVEAVIERGYLEGSVGVERNQDMVLDTAHAWAVYRGASIGDIIIDPAGGFTGTRMDARNQGLWRYEVAKDA